jgi:hypothetical protein
MKSALTFGSLVLLCIVTFAPAVYPQVNTADITGTVVDQSGAVVAGANVTVKNLATDLQRQTVTSDTGDYLIALLPPGEYEVKVEAQGFSTLVQKVALEVGRRVTLNFSLRPGKVTEIVTVEAEAPLIETTRSEIGGVVTPVEVQNLPLLNRTFANLSVIMPEARPIGSFDPTKTRVGTVGMNGGDGRQLDVNVDGADDKDNVVGSLLQNFAYESIQEFQVLQHRWTAESGRAVGGVINVVSKSGSNEWHGSFFANFRDSSLRRKDFFERQTTGDKPDFNRQELGGSFGGRIIRDKLFFFGAYERFRERQDVLVLPDALPQIAAIPGAHPVPTIPTPYDDHLVTAKIDHHVSGKQSIFYRFSFQKNSSPNDQFDPTLPSDLSGGNTNDNHLYSVVANHTYTFSPTKLNQFTFQFQDFKNEILAVTDMPNVTFPSVQNGANVNVPQKTTERKYQFRDDFSWQVRSHSLKFGTNYISTDLGGFFFFGAAGYQIFFFDDPLTILNNRTLYPQGFSTPGAVQEIDFNSGAGDTTQPRMHQLAFYFQDDYKVTPRLTLNLGLRWDANIHILVDQTNNRTMRILQRLNNPRAQAIARNPDLLKRTTPSYREFQPRLGFAYDPKGDGRMVVRGGYGIFYDQIFQNLTLFALQQSNPTIYQTVLALVNDSVGVGQLATFRFGVDPLPPPPPGTSPTELAPGGFGRINDPTMKDPYVQKFSIGFQKSLGQYFVLSSDYVHTLGLHEPRVQNINPRIQNICNPSFPGSTPTSPLCVRGSSTRFFDRAFVDAGLGAGRLEQTNMFTTTNRSRFDSWTTQIRARMGKMVFSASYILSSTKSWGGQPVASYTGNGIATTPENQFRPNEFGPTRFDERHRFVASGVFDLPLGIQLAPIVQVSSSRPYSAITGFDIDGDGRSNNDRICAGASLAAVFAARGNSAALRTLNPLGCAQAKVNSLRSGFVIRNGNMEEHSGRYINVDLRAAKVFNIGERFKIRGYADFYNLFDVDNLAFGDRFATSPATSASGFLQPVSLYGPGFGPPVGRPLTVQLGLRLDF